MIDLDALERLAADAKGIAREPRWKFIDACSPETVAALVRAVRAAQALHPWMADRGYVREFKSWPDNPCPALVEALAPFRGDQP